jgi:hypothetical protein
VYNDGCTRRPFSQPVHLQVLCGPCGHAHHLTYGHAIDRSLTVVPLPSNKSNASSSSHIIICPTAPTGLRTRQKDTPIIEASSYPTPHLGRPRKEQHKLDKQNERARTSDQDRAGGQRPPALSCRIDPKNHVTVNGHCPASTGELLVAIALYRLLIDRSPDATI